MSNKSYQSVGLSYLSIRHKRPVALLLNLIHNAGAPIFSFQLWRQRAIQGRNVAEIASPFAGIYNSIHE